MKIVLIAFHFAEYALRLGEALARDHDVLLMLDVRNVRDELGQANLVRPRLWIEQVTTRGLKNPLVVTEALRLAARVRGFRPDVVHVQDAPRDALMAALPALHRIPLVLTIHDHIPHSGRDSRERLRMRWYRSVLRHRADAVIVHGERIRSETEALYPYLRGRVHAVAHGILGANSPSTSIVPERGTLLFFGRVEAYKGLADLIAAVALLRRRDVGVRVVIAGRGEDLVRHRPQLKQDAAYELHERYIAPQEIPVFFARARAVVLPYTDATQSGVAAMAMAFGRPVIATDVGSLGEVVEHERNGLLVPPRNVPALAAAIERLVRDDALARELAAGAARTAAGKLSWSEISRRTLDVYRAALMGNSRRGQA